MGVFRGGCLTGPQHSGVELHGFLSYLVKVALSGEAPTRSSATRASRFATTSTRETSCARIHRFYEAPRPGEVYNIGGGRENSCSILEAANLVEELTGARLKTEYVETARTGDHICYISDLTKLKTHFPGWKIEISLREIVQEIVDSWRSREPARSAR